MKYFSKITELSLGFVLIVTAYVHQMGLLDAQMMFSGIILLVACLFVVSVWGESALDEREEHVRAKVDRLAYLFTVFVLGCHIAYSAFVHSPDATSLYMLLSIALFKIIVSKYIRIRYE
jgi:hypothetical protein